ncbi:MAG: class I SAM-dependent methyltransferase [Limisphaerales bacterium]|jgi:ubiquinone/menaquinone biosynthesis C-methylase UbiE
MKHSNKDCRSIAGFNHLTLLGLLICGMHWTQGQSVAQEQKVTPTPATSHYRLMPRASIDGIGKIYQGREISQVMGHLGASWLERTERASEERPDMLVESLGIKPGQVVADIGAGSGYFTRRLSAKVGKEGKVMAVDIQREMLDILRRNLSSMGITNVNMILGSETSPNLPPASVDLVLMVDVYHEFSFPHEMMTNLREALKPDGQVVWVEYRLEDPSVPIKRLHKMSRQQVHKEAQYQGFEFVRSYENLPRQHVLFYKKSDKKPVQGASKP